MADTVFPVTDKVASRDILRSWLGSLGYNDHVREGFALSDGGGLTLNVGAGKGFADGTTVEMGTASSVTLTDNGGGTSTTNHVYVVVNETDPAGSVTLETVTGSAEPTDPFAAPHVYLGFAVVFEGVITDIVPDGRELGRFEVSGDDLGLGVVTEDHLELGTVMMKLGISSSVLIPNGTVTRLTWDLVDYNKDGHFTFTDQGFTIPHDGIYCVTFNVEWDDGFDDKSRVAFIYLNGSAVARDSIIPVGDNINDGQSIAITLPLNANEEVSFHLFQNSGASHKVLTDTTVQIFRVGDR